MTKQKQDPASAILANRVVTRIALVSHTGQLGGAELASVRVVRALPAGIAVEAFLGEDGPFAERLREAGVRVEIFPMDPSARTVTGAQTRSVRVAARSVVQLTPTVRPLADALRARDMDLVWSTSLKAHLLCVPVARLTGLPLVWHLHDRISREYLPASVVRFVRALAGTAPAAVVANSSATAASVARARGLTVAQPGLTPEQFAQLQPPVERSTHVVGVLGRLSETKGQLEIVRLLPDLLRSRPEVSLRLIGGPLFGQKEYAQRVREEIDRLGLTDRVEMVGHVDDPRPELDRLAVCVHPATIPEPFGQAIAEAMARGTPVVATRGGGATELVEPAGLEPLGHLVPRSDPQAMTEAILDVLRSPGQARVRADRARAYVAENVRIDQTVAVLTDVFGAVLNGDAEAATPRVTLAHDYLTQRGGAERVVLAMRAAFPDSPVHTLLYEPQTTFVDFEHLLVITGMLNRIPVLRHQHRAAFPLLPMASSLTRVRSVRSEVTLVSSSGWAHAFRASGARVVYCHAPARWLYQTEVYLGRPAHRSPVGLALLVLGPALRRWDRAAMRSADRVLVNSRAVQAAVADAYGLAAEVVHPPPGLSAYGPRAPIPEAPEDFYLVVSRLLPYKHVDAIIDAFRELPENLLVVGSGPMLADLSAELPPNVQIVSDQTDAQLRWAYTRAHALIAASFEDFGLTPLEAALFGTPTLALRAGGYLDTVVEGVNGAFFDEPDAARIKAAVLDHQHRTWNAERIRGTVDRFTPESFAQRLREVVTETQTSRVIVGPGM